MFLLTYHSLIHLYHENENIHLIADIAQLIVYITTLFIVWRCQHTRDIPMIARVIFVTFALTAPEVFLTYAFLCMLFGVKRRICTL